MNEYEFDKSTFIGGWFINENLCDELINYFNINKHKAGPGTKYSDDKGTYVDKDEKDSLDWSIGCEEHHYPINQYREELQKVLLKYVEKYPDANHISRYNINEEYNMQYYPPTGGFKTWHCERANITTSKRVLVFMTYLNDVEDGGTEFRNQNIITPAKKGLTVLWPSEWTHTHKGQISNTKEKYIITGWYSFNE